MSILTQNKDKKTLLRVRLSGIPSWMPRATGKALARALRSSPSVRVRFSAAERLVLRRQRWLSPSLWAERRRVVRMSSLPGRWQNIFTPFLTGIMDASRFPGVEMTILCKTPQTGGTESALNVLGQMIEMSPGPALVVFPDELTAKENAKDRILPMLQDSPRLRSYMSGSVDDASSIRINLKHMPIYLGWSGSVSRLGNKPIRILILDELDKYQNPRKEATSEALAEMRTTTWKRRRFVFKLSTPTVEDGPIWMAFTQEAHARFDYHVPCPDCGTVQKMVFEQIRWPEGVEAEEIQSKQLAWYECPHCAEAADGDGKAEGHGRADAERHGLGRQDDGSPAGEQAGNHVSRRSESECPAGRKAEGHGRADAERHGLGRQDDGSPAGEQAGNRVSRRSESECPAGRGAERHGWTDAERDQAVRKGYWVERGSGLELFAHLHQHSPTKIGFHLPAWYSYFVSLSEVAAAYVKWEKSGRLDDLKKFRNQYCAEPWVEEQAERSEDSILALCDDRPRGSVPGRIPFASSKPTAVASGSEQIAETAGAVELASPRICSAAAAGKAGQERVSVLLAGVDTQGASEHKGYFRYVIRAFGYGEEEESWLVQCGVAPSFGALNELLWNSVYLDPQGTEHRVKACIIDAMGRRTKEVYAWALRHRGRVYPYQGVQSMSQPYTPAPQEYFPDVRGNKVKIPGGLNLWKCDVSLFSSDLAYKLTIAPTDPGAFHLHTNADGMLEQYAREMCVVTYSEEDHAWVNPKRKANHFWDCEKMTLALAHIFNVRHTARPGVAPKVKKPARQQAQRHCGTPSVGDMLSTIRR